MDKTKEYDICILTNIPAFYKVNLFNKLNEHKKCLVLFTGKSPQNREEDFLSSEKIFDYSFLKGGFINRIISLISILLHIHYEKIFIGGWDDLAFWIAGFCSTKSKNKLIVESSQYECKYTGIKGFIKRLFLKRIDACIVPGESNEKLLKLLRYKRKIVKCNGVGIFNIVNPPKYQRKQSEIDSFLYVGRLSEEKNLIRLINVFNQLPNKKLSIVGTGPQDQQLKKIANSNIRFYGAINNKELTKFYQLHDVFILPSTKEPWGLVVEEALNNGLPVIGSYRLGCSDTWLKDDKFGFCFDPDDENDIMNAIIRISDNDFYNYLKQNVSTINFHNYGDKMVQCFINL